LWLGVNKEHHMIAAQRKHVAEWWITDGLTPVMHASTQRSLALQRCAWKVWIMPALQPCNSTAFKTHNLSWPITQNMWCTKEIFVNGYYQLSETSVVHVLTTESSDCNVHVIFNTTQSCQFKMQQTTNHNLIWIFSQGMAQYIYVWKPSYKISFWGHDAAYDSWSSARFHNTKYHKPLI